MHQCSGLLIFADVPDPETGELVLRLREAHFCRVRHCPVCQWRRSLMWYARFQKALPEILGRYPNARWAFLTLTVRNCDIKELRATISSMNDAWKRLTHRAEFRNVLGWIRTTEVTKGRDESAHPHFHCMLMLSPSYFKGSNYVTQARWAELWKECLRADYTPIVDIRIVRPKKVSREALETSNTSLETSNAAVADAAREVLKYAVKPSDMLGGGNDNEWFLELTRQVHNLRFIATGGALKDALREDEETEQDLILADDPAETPDYGTRVAFAWRRKEKRYRKAGKWES
ncbi:protein rep [Pseudomonas aeruginosa]|nr:protein rep [Pseudomonas aeruginosa]